MKIKTAVFFLFIACIAAALLALRYEGDYREWIRYLYVALTDHKISFDQPGKYFYFFSFWFAFSFGIFIMGACYILLKQPAKIILLWIVLLPLFFVLLTVLTCYIQANLDLIACTACDDGTLILNYASIPYTKFFTEDLLLTFLPLVVLEYKRQSKPSA